MRRKQQLDSMLSGGQWYNIQASRAVNQVRHLTALYYVFVNSSFVE